MLTSPVHSAMDRQWRNICCIHYVCFVVIVSVTADLCHNTTVQTLPFMTERLVGYTLGKNETPICDYFLAEGWYRLPNFSIATSSKVCGTTTNWFINGTLPKVASKTVDLKVCANDGSSCANSKMIQVLKCDKNNFIFYLKPVDACAEAYCIESLFGSTTGNTNAPDISYISPHIQPEIVMKSNTTGEHVYYCDFNPRDRTLWYRVDWSLTNGLTRTKQLRRTDEIQFTDKASFRRHTSLKEHHLNSNGVVKIGYTILCSIVAKTSRIGRYSAPVTSPAKFFGFEIMTKRTLTIDHLHRTDNFTIVLTVPFACPRDKPDCYLLMTVYIPPKTGATCTVSHLAAKRNARPCGLTFHPLDVGKPMTMTVSAVLPSIINNKIPQNFEVILQTIRFTHHPMMGNTILDPIRVQTVTDTTVLTDRKCSAHSDPHMVSFDGLHYDNQHDGTFVMYRNENYNEEVQITTDKCSKHDTRPIPPWCISAVAVRAGRDVFIVDPTSNVIAFKLCEDTVLKDKVQKRGQKDFTVFLPTGTEVHLSFKYNFFDVDIFPSVDDRNITQGLCGDFDDNKTNDQDIPTWCTSSDSNICWKVKTDDNLFHSNNYKRLYSWSEDVYFCQCTATTTNVDPAHLVNHVTCKADMTMKCKDDSLGNRSTTINNRMCNFVSRRKRDIHSDTETDFDGLHKKNVVIDPERLRRSVNMTIYNETTARQDCLRLMNTTSVQMCLQLPGLNVSAYIDNCVLDAQISNSMDWTQVHIEAIKKVCIKHVQFHQPIPPEVLANITIPPVNTGNVSISTTVVMPTTTSQPVLVFNATMLENIRDVSCPNDCSGKGMCTKGQCICDVGYLDDDCSVDANQPPEMIGIPDKGKCDLSLRECARTSVIGRKFVDIPTLTCRLKLFQISTEQKFVEQTVVTIPGYLETFVEVFCKLPTKRGRRSLSEAPDDSYMARGYRVSVSNNGAVYSEEDSIMIFDSTCVNCTKQRGNITCFAKPGYCMKDGRCFKAGDTSGCYTCLPDTLGTLTWTSECAQEMPEPDDNGKLWIIGATIGPLAVLVIISLAVVCYCSKKGARTRQKMGSVNPFVSTELDK